MPQGRQMRELVARMKVIPNESVIRGRKGILLDESKEKLCTHCWDGSSHFYRGGGWAVLSAAAACCGSGLTPSVRQNRTRDGAPLRADRL